RELPPPCDQAVSRGERDLCPEHPEEVVGAVRAPRWLDPVAADRDADDEAFRSPLHPERLDGVLRRRRGKARHAVGDAGPETVEPGSVFLAVEAGGLDHLAGFVGDVDLDRLRAAWKEPAGGGGLLDAPLAQGRRGGRPGGAEEGRESQERDQSRLHRPPFDGELRGVYFTRRYS